MFPNDEVVAYGRANGLGSDYNDIMTAFLRDYYSSNLSLTDLWGRAWAEGFRSINGFTDFPGIANSEFYAPLTHSLILTRGTGNPTFTRATSAWEFDNEGKLITVPSGSTRFGGARMVRNIFGRSVAFDNASHWTPVRSTPTNTSSVDPLGGSTAYSLFETAVTNTFHLDHIGGAPAGISNVYVFSVYVKANGRNYATLDMNMGGISGYACFDLSTGTIGVNGGSSSPTITSVGNGWYRCSVTGTTTTLTSGTSRIWISNDGTAYPSYAGDITKGLLIWGAQLENVTGQADQTASEYVSVGVLSAPFHGAGVDGVKWFDTNKSLSAISESSLLGYHAEGARTNSLLYSRLLYGGVIYWLTPAIGGELVSTDFSSGWVNTSTGWTVSGGAATYVYNGSTISEFRYAGGFTEDKIYTVTLTVSGRTAGGVGIQIGGVGSTSYTVTANSTITLTLLAKTSVINAVRLVPTTTFDGSISNITVKEAAIQVTTCTGLDDAANSASTLTAGAADATILQTLSLAAAARSFSAYVKRRTGTGSVYITRDGGTNWTDITSSLGASWTRVKIENTSVLNPSVGFKIATSGDEIDVDVCQDEAGAFITSPIVTTTAAVTRNRDDLLYQFAGNASGTEGTLLAEGVIGSTTLSNASMITLRAGASSYNNFIALVLQGNGDYARLECYSGGAAQVGISTTNATSTHKASARYKTNDFAISSNGGAVVTDTSGNIPASLDTLMIGTDAGNSVLSSYIKNAYIWSTALTDAQLQQVTA